MLQQLPQVMSGLLGIAIAALAAYWIFLSQSQESIGQQVDDIGRSIVRITEDYPYNRNPFWMGSQLLDEYRVLYPDREDSDLLNHIGNDLLTVALNPEADKDKSIASRLASFSRDGRPVNGRVFFFLLHAYFESSLIQRPGAYMPIGFFPEPQKAQLMQEQGARFPFGAVGVEAWVARYKGMRDPFQILLQWREVFLTDYDSFLAQVTDPREASFYRRFNHSDWLTKVQEVFHKIEEPCQRIESLLHKYQSFSARRRIPHIKFVLALCALSFALGVALPLIHLSVSPATDQVPRAYNLVILALALLPLYGAGHIFAHDVAQFARQRGQREFLGPLDRRIRGLLDSPMNHVSYGRQDLKTLLASEDVSMSPRLRNAIAEYRSAVDASNSISRAMASHVADALNNNSVLRSRKGTAASAGLVVPLLSLLESPNTISYGNEQTVLFEAMHEGYVNIPFVLMMPEDPSESAVVNAVLQETYAAVVRTEEYRAYREARGTMKSKLELLGERIKRELGD